MWTLKGLSKLEFRVHDTNNVKKRQSHAMKPILPRLNTKQKRKEDGGQQQKLSSR